MAQHAIPPAKLARALIDPTRIGVIMVLRDGPMPEQTIAERLGTDRRTVARHGRELEELGFVRRSGRPPLYELLQALDFPDDLWDQMPTPAKHALVTSILGQINVSAMNAVNSGGFDRRDMHLTRTTLDLDEPGWAAVSAAMQTMRARMFEVQEEAAERLKGTERSALRAQAVTMLFTTSESLHEVRETSSAPDFDAEEGRERAWELLDGLGALLSRTDGDLATAVEVVDELRLVLRAAEAAERKAPAAPQSLSF